MGKLSCFSFLLGGSKKRSKVIRSKQVKKATGNDCPKVKPVEFKDMADTVDVSEAGGDAPACDTNVFAPAEPAHQERDAMDEEDKASFDAGLVVVAGEDSSGYSSGDGGGKNVVSDEPDAGESPSAARMSPTASPELKRSCSNIETARSVPVPEEFFGDLPAKSRSYGDLKALPLGRLFTTTPSGGASPTASVRTSCSADRIILKKRSSSQVLPSRNRKLWWRLFLWSHRNLHRPGAAGSTVPALPPSAEAYAAPNQMGDGYTSDTLDAVTTAATAREPENREIAVEEEAPMILPHQWVAFSSLDRVSAWFNSLENGSFRVVGGAEVTDTERDHDDGAYCSDEIVECPATPAAEKHARAKRRATAKETTVQTSSIVQTLNTVSSVAHISGMGLKAVPMIAAFSSLRAVNLSGNVIVHIRPGSLPKGLHSLDLSRNKIASIEGLRALTRLRVLNLSYNRISRIGHGLSSCTAIRELYLAGNKLSDVEGLHRLLKLAVLDVGFNKITTSKALGQLVANYAALRALNLVGNPVQANVSDDTLRKAVAGLLPRLEYLNKQAVKPHQRAREVAKDSVAQAALGNGGGFGVRSRRTPRRVTQSPGSSGKRGSRSRSKTRGQSSSLGARR